MTRRIWLCLLAVLAALLTACGPNSGSGGGEIVVTTNILGDVVRNQLAPCPAVPAFVAVVDEEEQRETHRVE